MSPPSALRLIGQKM